MNLNFAIKDEQGQGGQQVTIHQGEIKTLNIFWFDPTTGAPVEFTSPTDIQVRVSKLTSPSLVKSVLTSGVTALTDGAGKTVGAAVALTSADTSGLPVSSTLSVSVTVIGSGYQEEFDLPNAVNCQAPLVV
jgi:hypothetical protein